VRSNLVLLIAVILAMSGYSCKQRGGKYIDQGEIHFNIEYVGSFGSVPIEYLPQNLIVSFKKDKILFDMTGLGKSGILNLSNPEKGYFDTYFSFFTNRYYYAGSSGEVYPGFETMNGMRLKKTSKISVICGYNCKNAEATFPSKGNKVFDIWYTNEIKVKNPNSSTPFNQIDGVLMSFFFFLGPAELHFDAENVFSKQVSDETFERRTKFQKVTKEQIVKFIDQMISK
jgi:hypothetical protein